MSTDYIKHDLGWLSAGSVVEVTLENRANVLLLDGLNLARYHRGSDYSYFGGEALESPLQLEVPSTGTWHVVLDLGGAAGTIHSSVRVMAA